MSYWKKDFLVYGSRWYAIKNAPIWISGYIQSKKYIAAFRTFWYSLVLGHTGEACEECGMPYLLWWADDTLYALVTDNERFSNGEAASGLFCLTCFTKMAKAKNINIRWKPEISL